MPRSFQIDASHGNLPEEMPLLERSSMQHSAAWHNNRLLLLAWRPQYGGSGGAGDTTTSATSDCSAGRPLVLTIVQEGTCLNYCSAGRALFLTNVKLG